MLNKGIHRKSMLLYSLLVQRENKHDCVHECEWMSKCALLHRRWQWRRQHQRRLRWRRPNGPKTTKTKKKSTALRRQSEKERKPIQVAGYDEKQNLIIFIYWTLLVHFFFLFIFILPLPLLYASHWVRASERARLCFLVYFFFIHVILSVLLLFFSSVRSFFFS